MSIDEAFFGTFHRSSGIGYHRGSGDGLHQVGLTTTLSGGEAATVKLSKELSRRSSGHTLYVWTSPSVGCTPPTCLAPDRRASTLRATGTRC